MQLNSCLSSHYLADGLVQPPFLWPCRMQACLCPDHTACGCSCFKDHFPGLSLWTCHFSLGSTVLPPPSPISHPHKLPVFISRPPWDPTYHLSLSGGRNGEQSSCTSCPASADFQLCHAWFLHSFLEEDCGWIQLVRGKKKGMTIKGSQEWRQLPCLNAVKTLKWFVSFCLELPSACVHLQASSFLFSPLWYLSYLESTLHKHSQIYVGSSLESPWKSPLPWGLRKLWQPLDC